MENSKDKIIIYIDAANIILFAKNINLDFNIFRLINKLKDKYRSEKVVYFTGRFKSMENYFLELQGSGVELVFKEIYNENNKQKANCDVEISRRITYDVDFNFVSKIILCSGDGDFAHILDFANSKNLEVKVVATDPKSCSRVIKRREFTKLSFITDFGDDVLNEKPPTST
ncbi:MAG: NYN domain-containing protein [bacterium]